jgi:hypothetical protein
MTYSIHCLQLNTCLEDLREFRAIHKRAAVPAEHFSQHNSAVREESKVTRESSATDEVTVEKIAVTLIDDHSRTF